MDLHRNGEGAVKYPGQALAPVEAYILCIVNGLLPGDTDGVFFRLNIQVPFIDPPAIRQWRLGHLLAGTR